MILDAVTFHSIEMEIAHGIAHGGATMGETMHTMTAAIVCPCPSRKENNRAAKRRESTNANPPYAISAACQRSIRPDRPHGWNEQTW